MKQRTLNPKCDWYADYGGRGIILCPEWHDFVEFAKWADQGYKSGLLLDRIDNNGGYSPDNCKWSTPKESSRNKRGTILTAEDAAEIKAFYRAGVRPKVLQEAYGIKKSNFGYIIRGINWADIPPADYLCLPT